MNHFYERNNYILEHDINNSRQHGHHNIEAIKESLLLGPFLGHFVSPFLGLVIDQFSSVP